MKRFYDRWGMFAIFLKGLTPIPYKLVTILSGARSTIRCRSSCSPRW
ncbi:MAG: hypothetical protein WDM79_15965 [Terricaulis sp.]